MKRLVLICLLLSGLALGQSRVNLNDTIPAAPTGNSNVHFQKDATGNVSAYYPNLPALSSTWGLPQIGDFQQTKNPTDVRTFGAQCDGTTDDTVAIQNAVNAIALGGVLSFPPGTCIIRGTVSKTVMSHASLIGYGTVLSAPSTATGPMLKLGDPNAPGYLASLNDVHILGLTFTNGAWPNGVYQSGQSSQDAIQIYASNRIEINVNGYNIGGALVSAQGNLVNSAPVEWSHIKVRAFDVGYGLFGFYHAGGSYDIQVRRAHRNGVYLWNVAQINLDLMIDETLQPPSPVSPDGVGVWLADFDWGTVNGSSGVAKLEALRIVGNSQWNTINGNYYDSSTLTNNGTSNIVLNNNGGASTPQHNIFGSIYAGWTGTASSNKPTYGINQLAGSSNTVTSMDSTGTLSGNGNLPAFKDVVYGGVGACDGTSDDSATYNAQLSGLATTGGRTVVPAGKKCAVASTLNVPAQANVVSQDRSAGSFGEASTTTVGPTFKWTGANNSTMLSLIGSPFSSVQGLSLDSGTATGVTGIRYDSTNSPPSNYGLFQDLGFKGFQQSLAIGQTSNTVVSTAACASNPSQIGCYQADSWRLNRFQLYGGGGQSEGIHINTANSSPGEVAWGNIQSTNVGVSVLRNNTPITLSHISAGSFTGGALTVDASVTHPTQFYFGPTSAAAYMIDDECEGGYVSGSSGAINHYCFYDQSTLGMNYYSLGSQWYGPAVIAGNSKFVSISDTGFTNGTIQQNGSGSYVLALGDHALFAHNSGVFDYIDSTGWQSYNGIGVGSNGPSSNVGFFVSGFNAGGSTAPRAFADANTYSNCGTSCISFAAQPTTSFASSTGFGHYVADPLVTGAGSWGSYYAFYSSVAAGAGRYFLNNAGGAFSDFGTGIVSGSGNWTPTGKLCVGAACPSAMNAGDIFTSTSSTTGDVFFGDGNGYIRRFNATTFRFQGNGGSNWCWGGCGGNDFMIKDDGTSATARFRNGLDTADASLQAKILDSGGAVYNANAYSGSDWCAQVMAADAALGANAGEIQVGASISSAAACSAAIALQANHVLRFTQPGTYVLGSQSIAPAGANTGVICARGAVLSYTGTGWAYDINTQTQASMQGCQISVGTTPLGGIRLRNTGNTFETRASIKDVFVNASVWTSGQIGVLFQADNATSANYHSVVDVATNNLDIGAEFKSLVTSQGPNGNQLTIRSNGHTIAVQHLDGTDNIIGGTILGAKGGGNGIAFNFCAAGNGGFGSANNIIGPFSTEQGSTGGASKTINIASASGLTVGCGNSVVIGQSNDSSPFTDANGSSSTFNVHMNTNTRSAVPVIIPVGTAAAPSVQDIAANNSGLFFSSGGQPEISTLGTAHVMFATTGPILGSDMVRGWRSVTDPNGTADTGLSRGGAAGQVNVGNGTAADASGTLAAASIKIGSNTGAQLVASGTSALGTSAITNGTCATVVTTAATNTLTTDAISWSFNAAPGTGYTAGLTILPYVTAGNVNFLVCNPTAGSLTPAAATLNWKVLR